MRPPDEAHGSGDETIRPHMALHRSAFKIWAKFRQTFSHFHGFILEVSMIFSKVVKFINFQENYPEFQYFYGEDQNLLDSQISWDFATEMVDFFQKMIFQKL